MAASASTPGKTGTTAAKAPVTARALFSILGRNQGPELFYRLPFNPLDATPIPKNINLTRPMERLHVVWRGHVSITGANYTSVAAEAPVTIVQNIKLNGQHAVFNALAPINMTGATIFALSRITKQRGCALYINGVLQPPPGVPYGQVGSTFGNIGEYDIEIHYDIPLGPIAPAPVKINGIPFYYYQNDWGNTLELTIQQGDQTSFGIPAGGTDVTFSAFGSDSGLPQIYVFTNYEILGPLQNTIQSAVIVRNEQGLIAGVLGAASAGNTRIALLQHQKTINIVIKTGTLQTPSSPGVSVFATLSDAMLDQTQVIVDNKPVRNVFSNFSEKEYIGYAFDTFLPQGYLNYSFIDSMSPLTAYRGDKLPGGSSFEIDSAIISTPDNPTGNIMQEQIFGDPRGGATPSS